MVYNDGGVYSYITTKMCHVCKGKQAMPLWKRTYRCASCGLVMDRAENSAVNIFQRFVARLATLRYVRKTDLRAVYCAYVQ